MILVTGGAGFIGSNFVNHFLATHDDAVVNLDALTYAGNMDNFAGTDHGDRHVFIKGSIADFDRVSAILQRYRPEAIVNFAAESHVDRSINFSRDFIDTNIVGTYTLLEAARAYFATLDAAAQARFRFLHVSTDEVYGSLGPADPAFAETRRYEPNSPYSASKAASDHLVRAWHYTYGLPILTTNCSNNYGPFQFPEKLIPLMIRNALLGMPLPVYGDGQNVRDWLYVIDHCEAICRVLADGRTGETYNIGGNAEMANLDVVRTVCATLDRLRPRDHGTGHAELITFVTDRPGHDRRYAINAEKIRRELGWQPAETFATGLEKTVRWYLEHQDWVERATSGAYREWERLNYAERKTR
jgi:dTDP-glucose 4,6-dehydratase